MNSSLDNICIHFWDIEELGVDGVWQGTCRKCRMTRSFRPVDSEGPHPKRPRELAAY